MKIDCNDFGLFADAYIDGEFAERERVEYETHLESCEHCQELVDEKLRFKNDFKAVLSQERAPEALKLKIFEELEQQAAQQAQSRSSKRMGRAALLAGPLAAAAALLLFLPAFTIAPASSTTTPVVEQTIDWHRGDYPIEISSAEPQHVTRWFQGRVDFPVRLPHFDPDNVKLLGARIAHVKDRRAALVHYEVKGSRLSVMMFHGEGLKVPSDKIHNINGREIVVMNNHGYDVAMLQDGGITYTMTSELPQETFMAIVKNSLQHEKR